MATYSRTDAAAIIQKAVSRMVQDTLIQESVLLPTVMDLSSEAVPGRDRIDVPRFDALSVVDKTEDTNATPAVATIAADQLNLTAHKLVAWEIEDIAELQSAVNMAAKLTEDAARSLPAKVDDDIVTQLNAASAAAPDHIVAFNTPSVIEQTDILEAMRLLNDQRVPRSERTLLIPTSQEKNMLLISDFIRADSYGSSRPIQNGEIGMVYGNKVVVSTSANLNQNSFLLYHKSAAGYASQQAAKLESDRDVLGLKTIWVLSMIYGTQVLDSGKRQVLTNATGL